MKWLLCWGPKQNISLLKFYIPYLLELKKRIFPQSTWEGKASSWFQEPSVAGSCFIPGSRLWVEVEAVPLSALGWDVSCWGRGGAWQGECEGDHAVGATWVLLFSIGDGASREWGVTERDPLCMAQGETWGKLCSPCPPHHLTSSVSSPPLNFFLAPVPTCPSPELLLLLLAGPSQQMWSQPWLSQSQSCHRR